MDQNPSHPLIFHLLR